jgi:hypothetical protein
MISWLETLIKEKVEKMIEEKAEAYISKYLESSLESLFKNVFASAISSQVAQVLKSNERKITEAMSDLGNIDLILRNNNAVIKDKLREQLTKATDNIHFDIKMTPEYNTIFSTKIGNIIVKMIQDNPAFVIQIAKAKLADKLNNTSLFGEQIKTNHTL